MTDILPHSGRTNYDAMTLLRTAAAVNVGHMTVANQSPEYIARTGNDNQGCRTEIMVTEVFFTLMDGKPYFWAGLTSCLASFHVPSNPGLSVLSPKYGVHIDPDLLSLSDMDQIEKAFTPEYISRAINGSINKTSGADNLVDLQREAQAQAEKFIKHKNSRQGNRFVEIGGHPYPTLAELETAMASLAGIFAPFAK